MTPNPFIKDIQKVLDQKMPPEKFGNAATYWQKDRETEMKIAMQKALAFENISKKLIELKATEYVSLDQLQVIIEKAINFDPNNTNYSISKKISDYLKNSEFYNTHKDKTLNTQLVIKPSQNALDQLNEQLPPAVDQKKQALLDLGIETVATMEELSPPKPKKQYSIE